MTERAAQIQIVREVFGNPFRPPLASVNQMSTVASLAQAAYDERIMPAGHLDTARLAVLADAVDEAGCTEAGFLTHLRSPGPHVRGCWALDVILGKS